MACPRIDGLLALRPQGGDSLVQALQATSYDSKASGRYSPNMQDPPDLHDHGDTHCPQQAGGPEEPAFFCSL